MKATLPKKLSAVLSALVLGFGIAACESTPTSRSTGQFVDDATLTAKVKTEIARDEGVGQAAQINVDSYRGVVSLAGFVDSKEQARAAVEAARKVEGVREVRNNLQVKR